MVPRPRMLAAAGLAALLASGPLAADDVAKRVIAPEEKRSLAPIKSGAVSVHSPFDTGDCSLCHKNKNPKNPGPVAGARNKVCFACHEDFEQMVTSRRFKHSVAQQDCTACHNPHNAAQKKLLLAATPGLCNSCHVGIQQLMKSKVTHAAVNEGNNCQNCHNPHASNVEHLLTRLPFDQCVQCHSKDNLKDQAGVKLVNIKKLLDDNKVHHAPVAQKDCSACHQPHGSDTFRLLVSAYPAAFYAPFDTATYALCFGCHNEQLATQQETTTATRFRDGNLNLHFLHVNKPDRGRTCRACHEVHASPQTYQIRESVPFGPKGYILKVNFVKRENGGDCTQTCHTARSYTNAAPREKKGK